MQIALVALALSFAPALVSSLQAQQHSLRHSETSAAAPSGAKLLGRVPSSQQLQFSLALPLRNESQLDALLSEFHNPSSPQYKHFLTAEQFAAQFGPTDEDYNKVLAFAKANGLTVTRTYRSHLLVNVRGSSAQVEQVFHVKMQTYQHPTESRKFYAPDAEPVVSSDVPVMTVEGLSTLNAPHPMLKHAAANDVHSDTTGSGTNGQFLGSDIRAAYAPGVTLDGSGQTLGLVELGPYNLSDVQAYFSTINQPLNVPIYNVLLNVDGLCLGTPATGGCDDGEEAADIEQAIAMAPGLSAVVVYEAYGSGSDALTAFTQAANDNIAKEISLSFGWGGTPSSEPGYEAVFKQLAAQGQNVFVASGDAGANVGGVGYPGNSQYITAVGGTDLTTAGPGGAWQSEVGWIGSGGGWNTQASIPSYQSPVITSANQGSTSYRNIPDVAAEANTDNYNCVNGSCGGGLGGTSLAAPRWAGFLALVNQQANGSPIAFLNPTIYSIGQGSSYSTFFHDVTTGDNYNSDSPNMFAAMTGYDLVTGWGTPNGQALIDSLAPANPTSPNFSITATPAAIPLTPGGSATSTVTVTALNGFSDTVNLAVKVIGAPAGVTASLSPATVTGAGTATLSIETTSETPGGSILMAITGTASGLQQNTYVTLQLPSFSLSASPATLYLNERGKATSKVTVVAQNGFDSKVTLSAPETLPVGVISQYSRGTSGAKQLTLYADSSAATLPVRGLTVTGTSGATSEVAPQLVLAVSAALGGWGAGVPVDLSAAYNLVGIHSDGTSFSDNGMDGDGYAFSSNLLTSARTLHGVRFLFGKPDEANEVYGAGQTISLPVGHYTSLQLLGTGIQGNQASQSIVVNYEDGSTATFSQSFSDWYSPSSNLGEGEAVAMAYRDTASGGQDKRQFNMYGYALQLDPRKVVKSMTLPSNRNLILAAATLTPNRLGTEVNLSKSFNATGIYTDGTSFPSDGGIDGGGAAYSATTLSDATGPTQTVVQGVAFTIAAANQPNVVYGTGEPIELPKGRYETLSILGTGVQGSQTAQPIVVTYADGSKQEFSQSFSDWFSSQEFPGETEAGALPQRDYNDGSVDARVFNLYEYTLYLDSRKEVRSITLPNNRYVIALAITLSGNDEEDRGIPAAPHFRW